MDKDEVSRRQRARSDTLVSRSETLTLYAVFLSSAGSARGFWPTLPGRISRNGPSVTVPRGAVFALPVPAVI